MNAALKTWPKSLAHRPPPRNYLRAGARYFKAYARQQPSLIRGDEAEGSHDSRRARASSRQRDINRFFRRVLNVSARLSVQTRDGM